MKKAGVSLQSIEPIFEKIEALSKTQRILICVGGFIALIGFFMYFLYYPKMTMNNALQVSYENLEKQLLEAKTKAKNLEKYRKEMNEAEDQFKIAMKALPGKKEIPSLLTNISQAGQASGLEFQLFTPGKEVKKDFYAEIPVSIKLTGNYHNIALFFDKISRLYRIVNVKNINMAPLTDSDKLSASCTAVTYKFLETKPGVVDKKKK